MHNHGIPLVPFLIKAFFRVTFGLVLPPTVRMGSNVVLAYQGNGTVIHARAVIGSDVLIGPNVTIGGRSGLWEVPTIEDGVYIGAGARIIGPIHIGKGAVIGANAVVLHDVEPGMVVAGIPAKVIRKKAEVVKES